MKVVMVAAVASTSDITELILAQALVGKLAGADASDSSTIRSVEVIATSRRRLSSTVGRSRMETNFATSDTEANSRNAISSSNSSGSLLEMVPFEVLRSSRMLAERVHVNVTFEVVGSLAGLGYQNADAFEVLIGLI
jgi:hypothetical protein